jgi:hypothetical protein
MRKPLPEIERYRRKGYEIEVAEYNGTMPPTHGIQDTQIPAGLDETSLARHPQFKEIDARLEAGLRQSLGAKSRGDDRWAAQAQQDLEKLRKAENIRAWGAVIEGERIADDPGDYTQARKRRLYAEPTRREIIIYQVKDEPLRVNVGTWGITRNNIGDQTLNSLLLAHPTTIVNPQTLAQLINQQKPIQIKTLANPKAEKLEEVYQIQEQTK